MQKAGLKSQHLQKQDDQKVSQNKSNKYRKGLYGENYKTLSKGIKREVNKWKALSFIDNVQRNVPAKSICES